MSITQIRQPSEQTDAPAFALGGRFLEALAAADFDRLAGVLAPDVQLRALLPRGHDDWVGVEPVVDRFRAWIGDAQERELLDASVGAVGGRVQLHWRFRLRAARLGPGDFVIEQQAYVDTAEPAGLTRIDLLCSGFRPITHQHPTTQHPTIQHPRSTP